MKIKFLLIIGALTGCTPAEVQIAETVAHEAVVAEEAIENDLECPGCAQMQQTQPLPQGANNACLQPAKPIST